MRVVHRARKDFADTHGFQGGFVCGTPDEGAHRRATRDERLHDSLAGLASRSGDQDHA